MARYIYCRPNLWGKLRVTGPILIDVLTFTVRPPKATPFEPGELELTSKKIQGILSNLHLRSQSQISYQKSFGFFLALADFPETLGRYWQVRWGWCNFGSRSKNMLLT